MGKTRTGCIRQRPALFFARVSFADPSGKKQKIEQKARDRAHAKRLIKRIVLDLKRQRVSTVTDQRVREQRGGIFARVTYKDENGVRREREQKAESRTHARELIKRMLRDLDDHGSTAFDGAQITFQKFADYFEQTYLIEAQYVDGRKVAGLRDVYHAKMFLRTLRQFFGEAKLRSIKYGDIERFRFTRLKTPTHMGFVARVAFRYDQGSRREKQRKFKSRQPAEAFVQQMLQQLGARKGVSIIENEVKERSGGQRAIASVNRELALLGRMLKVAQREGWLIKNPFTSGDPLLRVADERKRERILSRSEEDRLLAACAGPRAHLRPILVCALDTGMRRGEIFKLKWTDIDFADGIITIRAFNTKTMRERHVAMTERLALELQALYENSTQELSTLCFGITDNVKHAFTKARWIAGLMDVRFHDLRHTHESRLVRRQISLAEVGRVLGHTQPTTTYRYTNVNVETARRVAAALDEFNKSVDQGGRPVIN